MVKIFCSSVYLYKLTASLTTADKNDERTLVAELSELGKHRSKVSHMLGTKASS